MNKFLIKIRKFVTRLAFLILKHSTRKDSINFCAGMVTLWVFLAIKWHFTFTYFLGTTILIVLLPGNWRMWFVQAVALIAHPDKKSELMERSQDVSIFGRTLKVSK